MKIKLILRAGAVFIAAVSLPASLWAARVADINSDDCILTSGRLAEIGISPDMWLLEILMSYQG